MVALRAFFVVLLFALASVAVDITEIQNPLSDEYIDLINSKQNSWKAGRNFPQDTPYSYIKNLMGVLPDNDIKKLPKRKHDPELIANLPESFDPRDKWPNCHSLSEIRDQGSCGSCWVFGAVEVMTDRYCIYSNGSKQFHFSAQDALTCASSEDIGCNGGWPRVVFEYWKNTGIVSGGNYNTNEGCQPYEIAPCKHFLARSLPPCSDRVDIPQCKQSCENNYTDYTADKRRGKDWYTVAPNEDDIKAELFKNGPVTTGFSVYDDFVHYKHGVYKRQQGSRHAGFHAVKILGWGVENGEKYWLIANSWNPGWGDKGFFKILRGEDHCGIESEVLAGEPLIE